MVTRKPKGPTMKTSRFPKNAALLALVFGCCASLQAQPVSPKQLWGYVANNDGSVPAPAGLQVVAFATTNSAQKFSTADGTILVGTAGGTQFQVEVGSLTNGWQAGEDLTVQVFNSANNQGTTAHVVLDGAAAQEADIRLALPAPCAFTFTMSGLSFGPSGGSGSFTVTAAGTNCAWGITSPTWVHFSSASGSVGLTGSFTVDANTGSDRSESVNFSGGTNAIGYAVKQATAPPGAVSVLSPANNAVLHSRRPVLAWAQSVPPATWFLLKFSGLQQALWLSATNGGTNWAPTADLLNGTYQWSVQSWNASGYGPAPGNSAFTIDIPRAVPTNIVLLAPSGSFDLLATNRYIWQADTNATAYELYITRNGSLFLDKSFTLADLSADTNAGTLAVDIGGHTGGKYLWWVRGSGADGLGPWESVPASFTLGLPGAVMLLAPASGAAVSTRQPALIWSQSTPAATWFFLSLTHSGAKYLEGWTQATNWVLASELAAGSYSWSVQTWASAGYGAWSSNATFVVTQHMVNPVVLVSPMVSVAPASTQRYLWQADPAATWYELSVSRNGVLFLDRWYQISGLLAVNGTELAAAVSGHTAGAYQWRVRGWNTDGYGDWSSAASFTMTNPVPPGAVTLLTPTNGAVLQPTNGLAARLPEFTWSQSSPAAEWFYLWLTRNGSKYLDQWVEGETNWTPTAELPAGSYTWWVETWGMAGYGPWSTNFSFTIPKAVPAIVTLLSPAGNVAGTSQAYTWKADPAATWYELYVAQNNRLFLDRWYTLSNSVAADPNNFAVTVSGHTVGASYQWWVRGWNADGYSAWSSSATWIPQTGSANTASGVWSSSGADNVLVGSPILSGAQGHSAP